MSQYKLLSSYQVLYVFRTCSNILSKTQEKRVLQGYILDFFLLDALKTIFWMENLTQRWTKSGPFFPKSGLVFWFSKRAGGGVSLLLLSCAQIGVAEYASISLNMPKYPWKCLNKLFWLCRVLNMPNHLTCSTGFWRCLGL